MNEMWEKGMIKTGDNLMLVGFGGGLTMAGAMLRFKGEEKK